MKGALAELAQLSRRRGAVVRLGVVLLLFLLAHSLFLVMAISLFAAD